MTREHGDRFSVRVGRDVSGQVVAGSGNFLSWNRISAAGSVTADELDKLREAFDEFRRLLSAEAGDQADLAQRKLDELEEAVTANEPDLATMEATRSWFLRKLPRLAKPISSLILHPIVTRLVSAAGDQLVAEFTRRFV
jgi:hypothetical protein